MPRQRFAVSRHASLWRLIVPQ